ncbi:hypothetical protein ACFLYO_05875 [Chloroflexota bacterium]
MPTPTDIIQLEAHDDVGSVRDRLAFAESYRVLLVWPPDKAAILSRKLDLVLLQREARRRNARIALLTTDTAVINNARDLNISTFHTLEQAQKDRWKRGRTNVFISRADKPDGEPDLYEHRAGISRRRMAPTPLQRFFRRASRFILLLLIFGLVAAVALIFLPSATIVVPPAVEHLAVTIRIVADPTADTINFAENVIPATLLQVEIEENTTLATTGSQDAAPTLAQGNVIFTNQTAEALTIPAGTIVSTGPDSNILFQTTDTVTVDGQQNAIAVVAIAAHPYFAGESGNVPAAAIQIIDEPFTASLLVENPAPTTGGQTPVNQTVTQNDQDRLLAATRGAIQQRALAEMSPLLGEQQAIIPETIQIIETRPAWTVFSAAVGAETATLGLNMRAKVQATVIDERLINQIAFAGLTRRIPAGQVVAPDSITFTQGAIEQISSDNAVTFLANVESDITSLIDTEQIKAAVRGMSHADVLVYLYENIELSATASPEINSWPPFYNRMPVLSSRTHIQVQGPQ